jgi:hypothetical protein
MKTSKKHADVEARPEHRTHSGGEAGWPELAMGVPTVSTYVEQLGGSRAYPIAGSLTPRAIKKFVVSFIHGPLFQGQLRQSLRGP